MGMQNIIPMTVSFLGIALAITVLGASIYNLFQTKHKYRIIFYLIVSFVYIYTLLGSLIRQCSGIVYTMSPLEAILLYAILLPLHAYFLYDNIRLIKVRK